MQTAGITGTSGGLKNCLSFGQSPCLWTLRLVFFEDPRPTRAPPILPETRINPQRWLRSRLHAFSLLRGIPTAGSSAKATVENATAIFGSYRKECQNAVKKRKTVCLYLECVF